MRGLPRTVAAPLHHTLLRGADDDLRHHHPERRWSTTASAGPSTLFGDAASWVLGALLVAAYLGLLRHKARHPDLADGRPDARRSSSVPDFYETARTGLHFLLPVVVLIWCLMVEELSPGLSAFWGTLFLICVLLTQRPIIAASAARRILLRPRAQGFERFRRGVGERRAQHDRRRHRDRRGRHHRRHRGAHRHRPRHDRDRRASFPAAISSSCWCSPR